MLRRLAQKIWVQAIFYFLLVLAVAYFLSWIFGLSGQIPCQETGAQHTNCPRYNLVLVALWQITELANWSAPAITAIATFFIALFTLSLWESGESNIKILRTQTKLMGTQATIALNQHLAEHRPHLRVRHVALGTPQVPVRLPNVDSEIIGGLVVVNVGGAKARIIDSRYLIHFAMTRDGLPMHSPLDDSWTELFEEGAPPLEIGESRAFPITGTVWIGPGRAQGTFVQLGRDHWTVYVMGQIRYQDDDGHDRFMGFCRHWAGEGTFRAVTDPDYEYED